MSSTTKFQILVRRQATRNANKALRLLLLRRLSLAHCTALLAGAALPLAFAPVDWYWLAVLSPAMLFVLVSRLLERDALWAAYLFGFGYFGTGVSWIYISIDRYGSGPVAAIAVTLAFIALLAVFPWSAVYLVRKLRPQMDGVALWLGLPAAWVLTEWVRLWFLTGFPWLFLGYSQVSTSLAVIAPVFGVLGVSLVLTIMAGGLAWFCLRPNICRAALTVGAIAAVWAGVALLDREWTYPTSKPLSVALIQGNMAQDNKWKPETLPLTVKRYRNLTRPYLGTDLIVWPETALPIWYDQADAYLGRIKSQLGKYGSTLILGIPLRTEQGDAYNAAVRLGDPVEFYYKRHLVPFGEYIPLRSLLGPVLNLLGAPVTDFTEGKRPRLLDVGDVPVGALICYDVAFGGEVADLLPDAQLLVNITNDAWFGDSLGPQQHLQIAQMRAIETGRPLLRAANTGITAVVDHNGRLLARAAQFEVDAISADVTPRRGMTPYVRWRDYPVLAIVAFVALALGFLRASRTR